MIYFDTLRAMENMTKAGLNKPAAESIIDVINNKNDCLVTKDDLRHEISELKSELKLDFTEVKSEISIFKKEIEHLKESMATKADVSNAHNENVKWMVGLFITLMLTIIGLSFK